MDKHMLPIAAALLLAAEAQSTGAVVRYELTVMEKTIAPAGRSVTALVLNDRIPGPTLRFRVGDTARIRVHNKLSKEKTLLHWHGLLVPNAQDGVPGLNTPAIAPGDFHDYEFELKHAGTYWYHSHVGLQEQRGLYGAIVVEPEVQQGPPVDRDHVVVLSDWTNEHPDKVMRTLVSGDEWYSIRKGSQPSILGAWHEGALGEYFSNQWARMPSMDISDVAYDAFWVNGKSAEKLAGTHGERVKLRLINAGAATYFYVQSAVGPMRVVSADGMAVRPFTLNRLLMGMGETYDVIVTLPAAGRYEVRATAQDGSGHASIWLGEGEAHHAPDIPKPKIYGMDWMLGGIGPIEPSGVESARPQAPYPHLQSTTSTRPPVDAPVREMGLRLTGNMERYTWSFNGKTLAEDSIIPVKRGEVLRIRFINDTMMHHPLHLHGHFFRLLNGQGDFAPLKHTFDVPPMGKAAIEFLASEQGDWVFHCHLLYHMKAGMGRVFSYDGQGSGHKPRLDLRNANPWVFSLNAVTQNNLSEGRAGWRNARNDLDVEWEYGFDDDEYETDLRWSRFHSRSWSTIYGYRITNEHDATDRAFAGTQHRLPLLADGMLTLDSRGDARVVLTKTFQLTSRLSFVNELEYDTRSQWEWKGGLEYRLQRHFSITGGYHSNYGFGAGLNFIW